MTIPAEPEPLALFLHDSETTGTESATETGSQYSYGLQRAGQVCMAFLQRLQAIQEELEALRKALREEQPKRSGVVLLELANCGKHCAGCPHIRWKQWRWHPRNRLRQWQAHPIKNPLRRLKRTGHFQATYAGTYRKIQRVQELQRERQRMIQKLNALSRGL
jgi:hypothetical protein